MAFLVNSSVIINDSRELIGVNTAGISTALYVGEQFEVDANTGITTVAGLNLNGTTVYTSVTADLAASATSVQLAQADAIKSYVDGQIGGGSVLEIVGDNDVQGEIDLANNEVFDLAGTANEILTDIGGVGFNTVTFSLSSTLQLPGSLAFGGGQAVTSIGIATDLGGASPSNAVLPTQQAVKEYVDDQFNSPTLDINARNIDATGIITSSSGLDVEANATIDGTLLLDAPAGSLALNIPNGSADMDDVNVGSALTVIGAVQFDSTLQFGGAGQTVSSIGIATDLGGGGAADTVLPTQLAVKTYVDDAILETGGSLNFGGDTGTGTVDLSGGVFGIIGTPNEIVTSGVGTQLTVALPDSVTIGDELTVTGNINANGNIVGDAATEISGIATVTVSGGVVAAQFFGSGEFLTDISATDITATPELTGSTPRAIAFLDAATGTASVLTDLSELSYVPDTGTLSATDFNTLSDIRYKENVETIEGALEKVDALRGVTYNWKSNGHASVGVIAQEVQAVLPQLISEGEEKITVNYNGLVGLLLQAVKELSARVEELESK